MSYGKSFTRGALALLIALAACGGPAAAQTYFPAGPNSPFARPIPVPGQNTSPPAPRTSTVQPAPITRPGEGPASGRIQGATNPPNYPAQFQPPR